MKKHIKELTELGEWIKLPHELLRSYPGGTLFVLRTAQGARHLCRFHGMLESDVSFRFQRLTDGKFQRLENLHGAKILILTPSTCNLSL